MKRRPNHAITKSIENFEFLTYRRQKIQNQKKYTFKAESQQIGKPINPRNYQEELLLDYK
jgi:hypothetical protein